MIDFFIAFVRAAFPAALWFVVGYAVCWSNYHDLLRYERDALRRERQEVADALEELRRRERGEHAD